MENLSPEELRIAALGPATFPSPLGLSTVYGDGVANYVQETESVLYDLDRDRTEGRLRSGQPLPAFERAGPRASIFFDPPQARAAIVTCGGLCPGINNVIRALVMTLHHGYGVRAIHGIRYGFQGFIPRYGHAPLPLDPEAVDDIHEKGGSILAASRGRQDPGQIVDCLQKLGVSLLFVIGGDGTLRGALAIHQEARRRGLALAVIGIPKTIDNDIAFVKQTFGLETAFAVAAEAIRSAHIEAKGAPNGLGIVKVMGRNSGFIAANAALALNDVNYVLVPEVPFDLEGPRGLFRVLEERLRRKRHAVIVVAEGAGQRYVAPPDAQRDESGNPLLGDIGGFLKTRIKAYFRERTDLYVCMRLAQNAVHAGMAGKTGMLVGYWNDEITHVPLALAAARCKRLSPEDSLWLNVLEATGQPISLCNDLPAGGNT